VGTPDIPAFITRIREIAQLELPESALSLQVKIADRFDNPIPGQDVSFEVRTGGGSIASASQRTNGNGVAAVDWFLGGAGENSVTASVTRLAPVTFTTQVGAPADATGGYFELERITVGASVAQPVSSWIALGKNGKFTMYAGGVIGRGDYSIDGSVIVFRYSDDFLYSLRTWLGFLADVDDLGDVEGETALMQDDKIIFARYLSADLFSSTWTYRQTLR
jgi:hypothetical protein